VDLKATKKSIKAAVGRLYDIQCKKINTLVRCVAIGATAWADPGGCGVVVFLGQDSLGQAVIWAIGCGWGGGLGMQAMYVEAMQCNGVCHVVRPLLFTT
jgi:hypothetical protein